MGAVITRCGDALRAVETRLTTWLFLVSERGDRQEAANAAAEAGRAVAALLECRPGKIQRKDENGVWCPASDVLAFLSWLWFVVTVLLVVAGLLVPGASTGEQWVQSLLSLVFAVPSALFASRQSSHLLTRRALRSGVAARRTLVWIRRGHDDGTVLLLTLGMWALWMTVLD